MKLFKDIFRISSMTLEEAQRFVTTCYIGMLNRFPEEAALKSCSESLKKGYLQPLELVESILFSEEFKINKGSVNLKQFLSNEERFSFAPISGQKNISRIVFFCFSSNRAVGGVKVIARYAELVAKVSGQGVLGELFFPESPNFELTWINFLATIKKDRILDPSRDYVILPEMWALKYGPSLIAHHINYSIFVQNGYLIFPENISGDTNSLFLLKQVYEKADLILTISDDVEKCLLVTFSNISDKLFRMVVSVKSDVFYIGGKKSNIISYMPRKLSSHSEWLVNQLLLHLPPNWTVLPIKGLNEEEVGKVLRSSKIFLSFSSQEGLGLPPLEAALCGNHVIGYTGEAGGEYWHEPIFEEINSGNLLKYLDSVLSKVQILSVDEEKNSVSADQMKQIEKLKNQFSEERTKQSIGSFVRHVRSVK